MEARASHYLRQYASFRQLLLSKAFCGVPPTALERSPPFHSLLLLTVVSISIAVFAETRSLTLL
eukprot:CAMPEP_0173240544 /NCGR_PEP_ID=MMETSP1142-20121109/13847_1 /TAXON_ID=483371 /ORGANISM="non described non described, Strain CCMP2298" /LENGTH=63 /DNA_ID=CAMNT_0014171721 /DNA_START=59 /DNA_END=247 /DNA_ORIENTATION=+